MTAQPLIVITPDDLRAIVRAEVEAAMRGHTVQPEPQWLSVPDAARACGVSVDTIRRRVRAGEIEARGSGKLLRVKVGP